MSTKASTRAAPSWASDVEKLARFEAVARLAPRTSFVKALLGLTETDAVVRRAIQQSRERLNIDSRLSRGSGMLATFNPAELRPEQRYICTVLLKSLLASDDSNVALSDSGQGLLNVRLIDKMIYVFQRYLNSSRLTVENAGITFEAFVMVYRAHVMAEIELIACDNCGGEYLNTRLCQSMRCCICATHNHSNRAKRGGAAADKKASSQNLFGFPAHRVA